jgi:hypothetical protein
VTLWDASQGTIRGSPNVRMAMRSSILLGLAVVLAPCDSPREAAVEPPAIVEAVEVEPSPPPEKAWPPTVATTPTIEEPPPEPEPTPSGPAIRPFTDVEFDRDLSGSERVRGAKARKTDEVRTLFADAGVDFPPRQLLFRIYKKEAELEVWASASSRGSLTHVTTYSVCAASGRAGPKRREGDWQVPEGFYAIDMFNPQSNYHLSMRVDYPNARDRSLKSTGGQIMIHGDCVSIGCVAIGDERIEELWVMGRALQTGRPRVHLFPGRDLDGFIEKATDPELAAFWAGLRAVDEAFREAHVIPAIAWDDRGVYRPKS